MFRSARQQDADYFMSERSRKSAARRLRTIQQRCGRITNWLAAIWIWFTAAPPRRPALEMSCSFEISVGLA
jgi:hypothetical protein